MVRLRAKPEPLDIDLKRTAVVVVDMQNSFVSKGGMFDLAGFDITGSAPVIEVNRRLLAASRKSGVKVSLPGDVLQAGFERCRRSVLARLSQGARACA